MNDLPGSPDKSPSPPLFDEDPARESHIINSRPGTVFLFAQVVSPGPLKDLETQQEEETSIQAMDDVSS
jgi:hypothetical protein